MKQKRIKTIITNKINALTHLSTDISASFNKDAIHNFRVTLKSLRAFLRFLQVHNNNKKIKITNKAKELYSILGIIREAQIELDELSTAHLATPAYVQYLQHTIELQKAIWGKLTPQKTLRKMLKKLTNISYAEMPPQAVDLFITGRWKKVTLIFTKKNISAGALHTARKRVKDMLHIEKLFVTNWKAAHKRMQQLPLKILDKLGDAIGSFNDAHIRRAHIKDFTTYMPENNEKEVLRKLVVHETAQLITLKRSVNNIARSCIKNMPHSDTK